jgi:hypothetical protein
VMSSDAGLRPCASLPVCRCESPRTPALCGNRLTLLNENRSSSSSVAITSWHTDVRLSSPSRSRYSEPSSWSL